MDRVVPWTELLPLVTAHSPKKQCARRPFSIETNVRIHFMQQWFGLSDPAMEQALHDTPMYRASAGLDDFSRWLADEMSILRFRHLLGEFKRANRMLQVFNDMLRSTGLVMRTGTVVDALPRSTPSAVSL